MKRVSIARRFTIGLTVLLLVVCGLFLFSAFSVVDHTLRNYWQSTLALEAENILAAIEKTETGHQLVESRLGTSYQRPFSGRYFMVEGAGIIEYSRSLWDQSIGQSVAGNLVAGPQNQQLLVYQGRFNKQGSDFLIVVAQDYTPVMNLLRQIQFWAFFSLVIIFSLILPIQYFLIKKYLSPLKESSQQLEQLRHGKRTRLEKQVPIELQPLIEQINQLLTQTENTLKRSRNAVGNLGHALKTPLTVLLTLSNHDKLPDDLRVPLQHHLQQIEQRLMTELTRAHWVGEVTSGNHFKLHEDLQDLVQTLELLYAKTIIMNLQSLDKIVFLPWDRADILELLGNLLDNACKWANTIVYITIHKTEDHYQFSVEDDGIGVKDEAYLSIMQRGHRLDEQVSGHGLGLSIVQDLVESLQGTWVLQRSQALGGLSVSITLPIAMESV